MQLLNLTAFLYGTASAHLNVTNHSLLLLQGLKILAMPFIFPVLSLKRLGLVVSVALSFFVQNI